MSEAQDILQSLAQREIVVWPEGSRLRYRSPKGALAEDLRLRLQKNKAAVLDAWREIASQQLTTHPATHGQRALWLLHQTMPQSASYNVLFSARLRSTVNIPAFRHACQALVDRHPALRTTFGIEHDILVQKIHGHMNVDFRVHEFPGIDLAKVELEVVRRSRVPFDLATGPLIRIELFSRERDDHVLLIAVHHIAADGWSIFLILDELRRLFPAECNDGTAAPSPRPAKDVVAFAQWQDEMLRSEIGRSHENYWIDALTGNIPLLALPTDRPRSTALGDTGASFSVVLSPELSAAVRGLAVAKGTTPYVVLLSAYQLLLHRYSGQEVVIVGSPTYGRDRQEFAEVVGEFVNMIPLKADFGVDLPFGNFVSEMRRRVIGGIEHQDYPFSLLVERLNPRRDSSHTPIFQTVFILQKFTQMAGLEALFSNTASGPAPVNFGGLVLEAFPIPQQEGQMDLSLELAELGGAYKGQFKYRTDLFDSTTIESLARHFVTLLTAATNAPETMTSRLLLLDEAEKKQLIGTSNPIDFPPERTLVALFEAQAARRPTAVAIRHAQTILTYGELAERSNQLARHLTARGVKPDSLVGLCIERSCDLLVSVLGILKTGAAYVPLDPGFPRDRLGYMLDDCAAPVLVTTTTLGRLFPHSATTKVCLDTDAAAIIRRSSEALPALVRPESRAYVLYTSGSTGRPKGVEIEHRALTNFLLSMSREPGLDETDVLLAVTTLSFDIAGLELFLPLVTGATIELAGGHTALDGFALGRLLNDSKATVMQATPASWRMLFESGWTGNSQLKVLCGGEALGRDLAAQLISSCRELWNLYGPTETTIWSSVARITSTEDISIGRPIANTQMYILDRHLEPVPRGVIGELWIGGGGVARGYLYRPELTGERFLANPFHPGRMYRTGDLARHRADGCLDCLGRADAQVKIRGFRIELGEIESVLGEHPAVTECAVVARELNGELRLVAYVTGPASPEDCRQHLRNRLPEYMVPAVFTALSVLPKTPNNKIDRNALPSPETSATTGGREYVAPASETEKIVAQVFAEVLRLATVGATDNFFELGGHSLLATRVMARLHQHFGIEAPLRALFEHPTTSSISTYMDTVLWAREQANRTDYTRESDDHISIEL